MTILQAKCSIQFVIKFGFYVDVPNMSCYSIYYQNLSHIAQHSADLNEMGEWRQ